MTPTYEELLQGGTRWGFAHKRVNYLLSFHGYRRGDEYELAEPHPGIWCYYLIIPEQMYPHRWQDFACVRGKHGFESPGPGFDHEMFDTEITWSSSEPYFCRRAMRMFDAAKVGCDYAHLWHSEAGYPDSFQTVKEDAIRTVEKFLERHPDRLLRGDYTHKWDEPDRFYTARNGCLVHVEDELPEGWVAWLPAAEEEVS